MVDLSLSANQAFTQFTQKLMCFIPILSNVSSIFFHVSLSFAFIIQFLPATLCISSIRLHSGRSIFCLVSGPLHVVIKEIKSLYYFYYYYYNPFLVMTYVLMQNDMIFRNECTNDCVQVFLPFAILTILPTYKNKRITLLCRYFLQIVDRTLIAALSFDHFLYVHCFSLFFTCN